MGEIQAGKLIRAFRHARENYSIGEEEKKKQAPKLNKKSWRERNTDRERHGTTVRPSHEGEKDDVARVRAKNQREREADNELAAKIKGIPQIKGEGIVCGDSKVLGGRGLSSGRSRNKPLLSTKACKRGFKTHDRRGKREEGR